MTKVCPICGREFESVNARKSCSEECAREKRLRDHRRWLEKQKQQRTRPKGNGPSLAEINARARALGLNYGQYVGKYLYGKEEKK